ncbi:BTB/POZ domain-containing protein 9-like [Contarinia nasturtii]|uniref:BTB/POZ domain-containing protein 9-like n=1 Tax=Contarinia nasturtii TaxID=265458 RepID=UPI0012D3C8E6|nr:BTB/POZ domain-containing protein 9-like [Contarinia nasturtii]
MASNDGQESGEIDLSGEVLKTLSDICMKDIHSDVTLIVENTKIPAHKTILSARSPYFQTLFNGNFAESTKDEIELKVPLDAFKEILKYIYTGCVSLVSLETDIIMDMCKLTEMYDFGSLKMAMAKYTTGSVTISNCVSTLNSAGLYSMSELQTECLTFMDRNASPLLEHETFKTLSQDSLSTLLKRDTFYAAEIDIFKAVQNWSKHNPNADAKEAFSFVRWSLMSSDEIFKTVLPSNILEPAQILNMMKDDRDSSGTASRIPFTQEKDLTTLNLATTEKGAKTVCGGNASVLLDGNFTDYDLRAGYTYHRICPFYYPKMYEDFNGKKKISSSIIVDLGRVSMINFIRILLNDKDDRSYSYVVDTSIDGVQYETLINYTRNYCRSWQNLYFSPQPVQFIKLVGKGTIGMIHRRHGFSKFFVNKIPYRSFDVVGLQANYLSKQNVEMIDGFIKPNYNIANFKIDFGVKVIKGVGGNNMLNDNPKEFTCHEKILGCILLQFNQPYYIGSLRMLLGNDKYNSNRYSFYIETSTDTKKWKMAVDKRSESLSGWQEFTFKPRPTTFIKLTGIQTDIPFICTYFECPCDPNKPLIMSKTFI